MKKKVLVSILVICLILSSVSVYANSLWQTIDVLFNGMTIKVNGQTVQADNILHNGTTYLPLRALSQALGANVEYVDETKTAEITMHANTEISQSDIDSRTKIVLDVSRIYIQLYEVADSIESLASVSDLYYNYLDILTYEENIANLNNYQKNVTEIKTKLDNSLSLIQSKSTTNEAYEALLNDALSLEQTFIDIKDMEDIKLQIMNDIFSNGWTKEKGTNYHNVRNVINGSINVIKNISMNNYKLATDALLSE